MMHRLMTRLLFLCLSILRVAAISPPHESGPTLDFFNYSGMQATISCMDHPAKRLEAGGTFSIPLSRSDQSCLVTLKDGEHASATLDKLLPIGSASSGHSVSVDINDTFLFFALDETPHHQYVNFHQQLQVERASDLLLCRFSAGQWRMHQMNEDDCGPMRVQASGVTCVSQVKQWQNDSVKWRSGVSFCESQPQKEQSF